MALAAPMPIEGIYPALPDLGKNLEVKTGAETLSAAPAIIIMEQNQEHAQMLKTVFGLTAVIPADLQSEVTLITRPEDDGGSEELTERLELLERQGRLSEAIIILGDHTDSPLPEQTLRKLMHMQPGEYGRPTLVVRTTHEDQNTIRRSVYTETLMGLYADRNISNHNVPVVMHCNSGAGAANVNRTLDPGSLLTAKENHEFIQILTAARDAAARRVWANASATETPIM